MSVIKVVKATSEDMPEVARLFRISRESALPYLPKLHTPEQDVSFFSKTVFSRQTVYVLKEDGIRLVGFIAFDADWIHHLYLLPEFFGVGLGAHLVKLAKANSKYLQLWVFKPNQRAIHFYEKHGFKIIKETDGSGNEEKVPDVLMEWMARRKCTITDSMNSL